MQADPSQTPPATASASLLHVERSASLATVLERIRARPGRVHEADVDRLAAARAAAVAAQAPYAATYRLSVGDAWRWVEERALPIGLAAADAEWIGALSDVHAQSEMIDALRRNEEHLLASVAAVGIGLWTVDLVTGLWTWSDEVRAILGLAPDAVAGEAALLERVHPEDRPVRYATPAASVPRGLPAHPFRILRADGGEQRWVVAAGRSIAGASGDALRIVGTLQDITDRRRAEIERAASELRLNAALKIGRMIVWDLDLASGLVTRSVNAGEILGVRQEPIADFVRRVHPADRAMVTWECSENPIPPAGDIRFRYLHPDGSQLWLETSAIKVSAIDAPGHIVGITTDITERRVAEERLILAADHDPLTGLMNRKAWAARLDDLTASGGGPFALLLVDIDHFKAINDSLGHDAGDRVLEAIGDRLRDRTAPILAAARLGGDEFAVVLAAEGSGAAQAAADDLIAAVCRPVPFGERLIPVAASGGFACFPDHATSTRDLVKNADLALYGVKHGGRSHARRFEPAMRAALDARLLLESDFRAALAAGQILPFYQPKLDLVTGGLVGFEALARWAHPTRGLLTPAAFGQVFEDGEIARTIGTVIRRAVFKDLRDWLTHGLDVGRVAVNCASHDFRVGPLATTILRELDEFAIPPARLEIEVTEGVMVGRDAENVERILTQLHEAGVKIALDDFGTGYASLIHLKQFPVDEIKVDRTFVAEMDRAPNDVIIRAIVAMGQSLGLTTVAEGVETLEQAEALLAMGCRQAQGFLFSKPMSAGRVPWFVARNETELGVREPALRRKAG